MSRLTATAGTPSQQARCRYLNLSRCVDVHCHCLAGLDDGPACWDDSLALCRSLVADGVTTVVATPHQLGMYGRNNSASVIREAVKLLCGLLDEHQIPLEVAPGADVRIDERLLDLVDADEVMTTADAGRHLLLELPHDLFVDPLPIIEGLLDRHIQPIITHPERYAYLHGSTKRMRSWIAAGAAIQVTAASLTGDFGRRARTAAWRLVAGGWASLIASDAHGATHRPPRLTVALEILEQEVGPKAAKLICGENPLKLLQGDQVIAPASL